MGTNLLDTVRQNSSELHHKFRSCPSPHPPAGCSTHNSACSAQILLLWCSHLGRSLGYPFLPPPTASYSVEEAGWGSDVGCHYAGPPLDAPPRNVAMPLPTGKAGQRAGTWKIEMSFRKEWNKKRTSTVSCRSNRLKQGITEGILFGGYLTHPRPQSTVQYGLFPKVRHCLIFFVCEKPH